MSEEFPACADCGMIVKENEYHPYAACLMFKGCKDGKVVRANLKAVRDNAAEYCAMVVDARHPTLGDELRDLKAIAP